MPNPSLVIRVAANIAELKKNLAEGGDAIQVTTAGMQKLAGSLDGSRLFQQANNIVAAVNQIGGASKLTESEQARLNATLERALEKYAAMGKTAPTGMRELADQTKQADTASSGLSDTVKQLAVGFAAMFSARAAFNFVADTIAEASALQDLSNETRIGVEELQIMAGAMSEFGVDADTLGKALYKLSKGIAGGDESVAHGLAMMGISLKDVEGLNGQELFLKIENGLSKLQGGLRDTAASELYGDRLGAAMAGASEGIEGAMETWKRLNHVASGESVAALDQYGEAIDRAKKSLSSMAADMIGPVAQGFNVLTDASDKGASKWDIFVAMTKDFLATNLAAGASTSHLATLLDQVNQKTLAAAAATGGAADASRDRAKALTAEEQAVAFLSTVQENATVKLTAAQREHLSILKDLGALNAKNAEGIGVSAAQYAKYTAEVTKAEAAAKKIAAAQEKFAAAMAELNVAGMGWQGTLDGINGGTVEAIKYYLQAGVSQAALAEAYGLTATQVKAVASSLEAEKKAFDIEQKSIADTKELWEEYFALRVSHGGTTTDAQIASVQRWFNDEVAKLKASDANWQRHYDAIEAVAHEKLRSILVDWAAVGDHSKAALQQAADKAKATFDYMLEHSDQFTAETIDKFWKLSDEAQLAVDSFGMAYGSAMDQAAAKTEKTTQTIIGNFEEAMGLVRQGLGTLGGTVQAGGPFQATRQQILDSKAAGRYYGPVDQFGDPDWAKLGVPARAMGGPVAAGSPYMVGERGPELFVPSSAGTVLPSGSGGTVLNLSVHVTQPLGTPDAIARVVGDAVMSRLKSQGVRLAVGV